MRAAIPTLRRAAQPGERGMAKLQWQKDGDQHIAGDYRITEWRGRLGDWFEVCAGKKMIRMCGGGRRANALLRAKKAAQEHADSSVRKND